MTSLQRAMRLLAAAFEIAVRELDERLKRLGDELDRERSARRVVQAQRDECLEAA